MTRSRSEVATPIITFHGEALPDLIGLEAEMHRTSDAGKKGDVVKLGDMTFEREPVDDVSGFYIDDQHRASGLRVPRLQIGVELQTDEANIARERDAYDREASMKVEASQESGASRKGYAYCFVPPALPTGLSFP